MLCLNDSSFYYDCETLGRAFVSREKWSRLYLNWRFGHFVIISQFRRNPLKIGGGDPELGLPLWLDRMVFAYALLNAGYREEAVAGVAPWLMSAAAGIRQLADHLGRPGVLKEAASRSKQQ
jgi:hypothetical protein